MKIFWGTCPWSALETDASFFQLFLIQSFCHLLKTLLKTLIRKSDSKRKQNKTKGTCYLFSYPACKNKPFSLFTAAGGCFMRRNVCHSVTEIPYPSPDDIKSVQNLVISADWMMEWSHSFIQDLQWNNRSQLSQSVSQLVNQSVN